MNVIMRDRARLPRRDRIKIKVDHRRIGRVRVFESQVFDGVIMNAEEATLTRAEARELGTWLLEWAGTEEAQA